MSELKNKTIITVATTGAWPTKANNPNVPMTPEEISEDVYACWKAGAAIAHLHMRDDEGHGTMDKEKFRKTVELLRANHPDCDIILNMTTSGDIHADDTTRQIHLKDLRPRGFLRLRLHELAAHLPVPQPPCLPGGAGQEHAGVGRQAGDRGL